MADEIVRDPEPIHKPQVARDAPAAGDEQPSPWAALWEGLKQGAGDVPLGVAQLAQHAAAPLKRPFRAPSMRWGWAAKTSRRIWTK